MKIKFDRYDIMLDGYCYCILIPPKIEQLWITGYGNLHWGTNWEGNRDGLKALLYSSVVLGFNPTDKIIYFPIRKNCKPEYYKIPNAFPEMEDTYINDCDLIFTTHQTQLQRSKWKKIKNIMRYSKSGKYILNYDRDRTEKYFRATFDKWNGYTVCKRKEYLLEIMQDNVLFQVFSRMQFQQIYLQLHKFLQRNLEMEFVKNFNDGTPWDGIWLEYNGFIWREKLQMNNYPWVIYCDKKYESIAKKKTEKNVR